MNHLTIDLQGGTRTVVVDWTHGNEELTDYELGPRGERVYFPSLLDKKCHDGHGKDCYKQHPECAGFDTEDCNRPRSASPLEGSPK